MFVLLGTIYLIILAESHAAWRSSTVSLAKVSGMMVGLLLMAGSIVLAMEAFLSIIVLGSYGSSIHIGTCLFTGGVELWLYGSPLVTCVGLTLCSYSRKTAAKRAARQAASAHQEAARPAARAAPAAVGKSTAAAATTGRRTTMAARSSSKARGVTKSGSTDRYATKSTKTDRTTSIGKGTSGRDKAR